MVEVRSIMFLLGSFLSVPSQSAIEEDQWRLHRAQYERVHAGQHLSADGTGISLWQHSFRFSLVHSRRDFRWL